MPHMVTFTSVEGKKGYHQCEELDEAVRFVERLRNNEGVSDAQVFRMDEVQLEVKQYYKVEVATSAPQAAPAPALAPVHPAESHQVHHPVEVPLDHPSEAMIAVAPVPAEAHDGRPSFSIFSKS